MDYGIANKSGKPDLNQAKEIIQIAWESGIKIYDTAQAYGESEKILGKAFRSMGIANKAKVITKLDPDLDLLEKNVVENAITRSMGHLGVPVLYGLLLHREEYLEIWDRGLREILQTFVQKGLVKHVGASLYSPDSATRALKKYGIDMIQVPSNILDRRFENAGIFELARIKNKEIYLRSVFLQGLTLMKAENLPVHMQFAYNVLTQLEDLSWETGLSKQELSISYVKHAFPETKVVFGAEHPEQIRSNLRVWEKTLPDGFIDYARSKFGGVNEELLNPALWPKN